MEMPLCRTGKSCWRSPCKGPSVGRSQRQEFLSSQWSASGLADLVSFTFARFPCFLAGWVLADDSSSYEVSHGAGHFLRKESFAIAVDPSSKGLSFAGKRHLKSPA